MANLTVNVTEILGTDSMNNSRITINNNFTALKDSINRIATVVDFNNSVTTVGGSGINFNGQDAVFDTVHANLLKLGDVILNPTQLQQLLDLL